MKKFYLLILFISFALLSYSQVTISPNPFEVDESITITLDINSSATDCNGLSNPSKVYMHSGIGDESNAFGFSVVGNWGQDDGVGEMTNMGGGIFSITLVPETYYGLTPTQAANAVLMGMVFRNANGTQELKANGCNDFIFEVGTFQVSLSSPSNETTIITSGGNLDISATNIGGNASYTLYANGAIVNTNSSTNTYNYTDANITESKNYELVAVLNGTTITKSFSVLLDPGSNIGVMPTDYQDGITYIDDNTAVLVLYATGKDFVYVAGSFNNYQPSANYAMKKDPTRNNKFWLELTDLTANQIESYQYWVVDKTPPANSPTLVKVADPYSTLVLSPFDDPSIPASTYPNLPTYPAGQEREVTVLSVTNEELFRFSIYPNPSSTSFGINVNTSNIEVYNLTGKLVKSFTGNFTKTDVFDISALNSGMYIVKAENNNSQIMTTKLVKL